MQERLNDILSKISSAKRKGGYSADVTIVGASKTQPVAVLERAKALGVVIFGENRTNELIEKYGKIDGVQWHFIGTLQKNKVKYICDKVSMIQSVNSVALASEINKKCGNINKIMPILIEVNIAKEPQKSGVMPEELDCLVQSILSMPNLLIKGFMCIMPIGAEKQLYLDMKALFDQYSKRLGNEFNVLSCGMSDDYEIAVECGANMIRLGRALFGDRK